MIRRVRAAWNWPARDSCVPRRFPEGRFRHAGHCTDVAEAIEEAEARGFQAGQEAMRERAAKVCYPFSPGAAALIIALPVVPK